MQNKTTIHMELEEVETQAEQLESFLLMLEQSLYTIILGEKSFYRQYLTWPIYQMR